MDITITINCKNEAFKEASGLQVASILNRLANKLAWTNISESDSCSLLDDNGNKVGRMEISE